MCNATHYIFSGGRMKDALIHPGTYVKEYYLDKQKLTVTKAAELVGISRPNFSKFLNGHVSATVEMATRLERAFGIPSKTILDLQAKYDVAGSQKEEVVQQVTTYAPPFLNVQANQLEQWFTTHIHGRTQLPVLLRTLIHSTGHDLKKVDFPGNDDAQRPGWDGWVEAESGTPWIPLGISGWEFGVNSDIKGKADSDFAKSVQALDQKERDDITFVFVTPRRWAGKSKWIAEMEAKQLWKDVRAYDSSDLEQWLEQSLTAQTWFANRTGNPSQGVRSLDKCWEDWANVTAPNLHPALFEIANKVWKERIKSFLENDTTVPLVITADSVEEALAFLSQILAITEFEQHKDRVLVFDTPGVLTKLAAGTAAFIAVAYKREIEQEFGTLSKDIKTIVVYPRNATSAKADIVLDPLTYDSFSNALELMGMKSDDIKLLDAESGRSLTVLRRRLAKVPAIQIPQWADDNSNSEQLIPFVLTGVWNIQNEADRKILSSIAGDVDFESIEKRVVALLKLNDSPVWSVGAYRGVMSKIDSLFAISGAITRFDLDRFFEVAKIVLGEDDPSLDLPEEERWAASIYGKKREYSSALREGVSETLVLLAVHGTNLFGERLGFDGEREAEKLVSQLLEPLDLRKLKSNQGDFPLYAEAAPNKLLSILESDLMSNEPIVIGLLKPANVGFGFSCSRTGLIWALECLAWNPLTFPRVIRVLARLSEVEINDNWTNKPINSLYSIFKSWMPQTAVDADTRYRAMQMLFSKFPEVGWKVCVQQFGDRGNEIGHPNYKPKWRPDGYGYGKPFDTWEPIIDFTRKMVELALTRDVYSTDMICDLISRLHGLANADQNRVWEIIKNWYHADPSDSDIAKVREKIRTNLISRTYRKKTSADVFAIFTKKANEIYEMLLPKDVISQYEWLFNQAWVDVSADELFEDLNYELRDKKVQMLRIDALKNIISVSGIDGVFRLAEKGSAQHQIGSCLGSGVFNQQQIVEFVLKAICLTTNNAKVDWVINGILQKLDKSVWKEIYAQLESKIDDQSILKFLLLSPYRELTWQYVDSRSIELKNEYWKKVVPYYIHDSIDENHKSIRLLLVANRPRIAFNSINFILKDIEPSLIVEMLRAILEVKDENFAGGHLDEYYIREAFKLIDNNQDLGLEEKAILEFGYLEILGRSHRSETDSQIPNLERYIAENPNLYIQAIVWTYKRDDAGIDPEEYLVSNQPEDWAKRGYRLLEALTNIPGLELESKELQTQKLIDWISQVRSLARDLGRLDVTDLNIGKLLSNAPVGADGIWPDEAIREVLEGIRSSNIADGVTMELYNSRGVHFRGEGGSQEWELANKYRKWAQALEFSYPWLANNILMSLVRTYEHEAQSNDMEAGIRRRLRH